MGLESVEGEEDSEFQFTQINHSELIKQLLRWAVIALAVTVNQGGSACFVFLLLEEESAALILHLLGSFAVQCFLVSASGMRCLLVVELSSSERNFDLPINRQSVWETAKATIFKKPIFLRVLVDFQLLHVRIEGF